MERRRRLQRGPSRAWWLTAAAAALVSLTAAAAPAPVVATQAPELRLVCDEQRTRCEWLAVAAYGLRRPRDQWPRQSPFSAGWKRRYGGGTRSGRRSTWSSAGGRTGSRRPFAGDEKRAGYAFSSWGGKRSPAAQPRVPFDAQRPAAFSGWSGKRAQRFFHWGGKRSLADNEMQRMATAAATVGLPTTVAHVDHDDEINK